MANSVKDIQSAYLAYFNRPADPAGLAYWTGPQANGGIVTVLNAFASSQEFNELYPDQTNIAGYLNAIYNNLFNRNADAAGLTWWTNQIVSGKVTPGFVVWEILNGAQGTDKLILDNKVSYCTTFTTELAKDPAAVEAYQANTFDIVRDEVQSVDGTQATLAAAVAAIPTTIAAVIDEYQMSPEGSFVLTSGLDVVTGGATDDVVSGGTATLTVGDDINGGGGHDTLNLQLADTGGEGGTGIYAGFTMQNVEHMNIRALGGEEDTVQVYMTGVEDLQSITVTRSTANLAILDLQDSDVVVNLDDVTGTVMVDFDNQNAPDSLDVTVTEVGTAAVSPFSQGGASLEIDPLVNIVNIDDAPGDPDFYNDFDLYGAFEELNVTGGMNGAELGMYIDSDAMVLDADFTANASDDKWIGVNTWNGKTLTLHSGQYSDEVDIYGSVTVGSLVDLGAGDDDMWVDEDVDGTVLAGTGNDSVYIDKDIGAVDEDTFGLVDLGAGDDYLQVGDEVYGEVLGGDGNDEAWVGYAVYGNVDMGAGNDDLSINTNQWDGGGLFGDVDLGTGNDSITIGHDGYDSGEAVDEGATVKGGEGADSMVLTTTVYGLDSPDFNVLIDGAQKLDGGTDLGVDRITGIESLTVQVADGEDGDPSGIQLTQVDLSAFDAALTTVNVEAWDHDIDGYFGDGDAADLAFYNWTAEAFTVSEMNVEDDDESAAGVESLVDGTDNFDAIEDVTLSIEAQDGSGKDDTVSVSLIGDSAFDVGIYDITTGAGKAIEHLELDTNDQDHTVDLDEDFAKSLTVTGGAAGVALNILGVASTTVTADIASDVYLDLDADKDFEITTGSGDDVINANSNVGGEGDTIDEDDVIDMGDGTDRLIVSQDMGDIADENDSLFETKFSIEELQFNGDGAGVAYEGLLDDDAYDTGIQKVILTNNVDLTLEMGNDFESALTIDIISTNSLDLTNDSTKGTGQYDVTLNVDITDDDTDELVTIDFTDTGNKNTVVMNVAIGEDTVGIADFNLGADDNIVVNVTDGDGLDKIVFADATGLADGEDNGWIDVALSTNWRADGVLTIDGSAILDDDEDGFTGDIWVWDGEDGNFVDYAIDFKGTENNDGAWATEQNDILSGAGGEDYLLGFGGADEISGGAGNDTVWGGAGNDEINLDAGGDWVVFSWTDGFALTGDGRDQNTADNGRDTVTGFTAGDGGDVFVFGGVGAMNWGEVVAGTLTLEEGNDDGGDLVVLESIDLSGIGRITLESEIAVVQTISVTAEDNATVAGWMTDASQGGVIITGNAGSDELLVWYVNNDVDGQPGQITADDVSLVGMVTLTGGDIGDLTIDNLYFPV